MHQNIGTLLFFYQIVWTVWKLYFTINILSLLLFLFFWVLGRGERAEVCCPDKCWLTIKEIYWCIVITIEKYIELNGPNWNVSIVHKCSTPFRFILSLGFAIAVVCHRTYYYYYCFVPFDIVLKRVKRSAPEKKYFYGFCFVLFFCFVFLIRLNRKLLFFSNLTLGSI